MKVINKKEKTTKKMRIIKIFNFEKFIIKLIFNYNYFKLWKKIFLLKIIYNYTENNKIKYRINGIYLFILC